MARNAQTDRAEVLGITAALLALAVGHSTPSFATDCDPDLIDKVSAADGSATDSFGLSAAVDGDTAVIGAVWDDDHGFNSGSAYVFVRSGGAWVQQAKLLAPDGAANDNFGRSAGISGDTIVIGAQNDDDHGTDSGSANIFVRTGNTWTWQAKLTASDGAPLDRLGWQIDISGDTVVASSHRDNDHGPDSGSAYVFVRAPDGTWFQEAKLTASDAAPADEFGHAVAISGDTILVGAYKNDDAGSSSGAAYVFVRSEGGTWTEQAKLTASNANTGYHFARFLDVDGDTALIVDMQLLQGQVDVACLPIGDNFTMGPDDAVRAVEFIQPKTVIPMHYNTFDLIKQDPNAFARNVGDRANVVILEPGSSYQA